MITNIKYKKYYKKDLFRILNENEESFFDQEILPITRHRLLSHINNPYADPDDLIIVTASINDKIIGYRVMLPDYIKTYNGLTKTAWTSTTYLNPKYRSQGIGKQLTVIALDSYDNMLCSIKPSALSTRMYLSTGKFKTLLKYTENEIQLFSCLSDRLKSSEKKKKLKKLYFVFYTIDSLINLFQRVRIKFFFKDVFPKITFYQINYIDRELDKFITSHSNNLLFKYSKEKFNWLFLYHWVNSSPLMDNQSSHYFFSSYDTIFYYSPIKIIIDNKIIGFILFQRRNNKLKIPYIFYNNKYKKEIISFIVYYFIKSKSSSLIISKTDIFNELKKRLPLYRIKQKKNRYLIPNNIIINNDFVVNDGDGDIVFI